jgi:membrane fusion protein, multidrug efflux system
MKNRGDFLFKAIVTGAIMVSLVLTVTAFRGGGGASSQSGGSAPAASRQPSAGGAAPSAGQQPSGGQRSSGQRQSAGQAVEAYVTSLETVSNYIRVNGDIITEGEVEIFPDTSGKLISLSVSEGDRVEAGQTVALVDPSLPGQKFSQSAVYATIGGTVLSMVAHRGDKVTGNTPILTIGDLTRLKLITYVPEKFAGFVKIGLPAEVTFAAFGDRTYRAEISEVGSVINPTSRTLEVTLTLKDRGDVKPGMFASIKLVTEQALNTVAVPAEAIFSYYGKDTVFVINSEGQAERREIVTGLTTSELVEIRSGVEPGEAVITAGQSLLKEGSPVHAVNRDSK